MAKIRTYSCPGCGGHFDYMHHPSTDIDPPRYCPLCGLDTAVDDEAFAHAITAPMIGTKRAQAGDLTYRGMEAEAQARIAAAAEMTGQPESDFNDMKITDLKDNLRQGDTAAVPLPPNPVTQRMAEMEARGMPVGFGAGGDAGQYYAEAVKTGPHARSGLGTATGVKAWHQANASSVVKTGEQGRY